MLKTKLTSKCLANSIFETRQEILLNSTGKDRKQYLKGDIMIIAVLGCGSSCEQIILDMAEELGSLIAKGGHTLVCGGLGGVMEKAAEGAKRGGGVTVGVLPGQETKEANPHITVPVATGMGIARNAIIARTADVCIAVGGGYGTLSEISLSLNLGTPVVSLHSWDITKAKPGEHPLFVKTKSPEEALSRAEGLVGEQRKLRSS